MILRALEAGDIQPGIASYQILKHVAVEKERRTGSAGSLDEDLFSLGPEEVSTAGGETDAPSAGSHDIPVFASENGGRCVDSWIATSIHRINSFHGSDGFKSRKPFRINKFGFTFDRNAKSNFAPDNWNDYGANRNAYMWNYLYPSEHEFPRWACY